MKIPPAKVDAFIRRPESHVRVFLIYGPDNGLVRERFDTLSRALAEDINDPFLVADLAPQTIQDDPARLVDEASSLSLVGGQRLVRVAGAGDGLAPAVRSVLELGNAAAAIIIAAEDLNPRSTLRKAVEASDLAAAIPCYVEDEVATGKTLRRLLGEAGLGLDRDAETLLSSRLVGDRMILRREVEKLALYKNFEGTVTIEDAQISIPDSADLSIDQLSGAAADGDIHAVDRIADRLFEDGQAAVGLLRGVQRYFGRLLMARSRMDSGASAETAIKSLKPPVFFKQVPAFQRQLQRWPPARLDAALDVLIGAEAQCKRTGIPDRDVCMHTLLDVARVGRALGRSRQR